MGDVKFIRKNGRVIPISGSKGKGAPKSKASWKPGGSSYNRSISQHARLDRNARDKSTGFALVGGGIGAALAGPIGALLGASVGHVVSGVKLGKVRKGESNISAAKRMARKMGTTG